LHLRLHKVELAGPGVKPLDAIGDYTDTP
jgi:hypothetical protein